MVLDLNPLRLNTELVDPVDLTDADVARIRELMAEHQAETGSLVAAGLLNLSDDDLKLRFTKVEPRDYARIMAVRTRAMDDNLTDEETTLLADGGRSWLIRPRSSPPARVAARRPVEERVGDWQEVYPGTPGRALLPIITTQASRCMDCGIPFCHQGCPLGNIIPEWNDLVWRDDFADAIERLHATNNFPEFTGRLCPAPCETACVLGINQDPVTIKNVEVAIIDKAWDDSRVIPQQPAWHTAKTVAVVGSGPAGLAAAQQLTRAGHTVVVHERSDAVGGLLRYGIPEFKMEKAVLNRRLKQMVLEGPSSRRESRSAATSPAPNCWRATTPSCWPPAPPCRATCRCPAASSAASTRRWNSCRRPTGWRWGRASRIR